MKILQSLKVLMLSAFLALSFQSLAQSPHSEVTLSAGINQVGLDYAFLFGETRRHILEVGVRLGDGYIYNSPDALSSGGRSYEGYEFLYHYVLNSNEKFNFSAGVGFLGTLGYISVPLTFRYKIEEHVTLRARVTGLVGGLLDVKTMPSVGFAVAF